MSKNYLQIAFILILILTGCSSRDAATPLSRELSKAEGALREQQFEEAIGYYKEHIEQRKRAREKPDWENPYFYYLIIGDIYLKDSKPQDALKAYEYAEEQGVAKMLVSDRYRTVARWLEENDKLQEAIDLLEKYQDRDPLLFDSVLDRVAKQMTHQEEKKP